MRQLLALIGIAIVLAGCNTMAGLGRDIESAGEAIQRGAKR